MSFFPSAVMASEETCTDTSVSCPPMAAPDTGFVYLSQEDVVAAAGTDMAAMVDVLERAFRLKAAGQVRMPPKVMITWADEAGTEERDGRIMAMPAYVGVHGWVAVDLAGVDPEELRELVNEAWLMTAPKRLTREFDR